MSDLHGRVGRLEREMSERAAPWRWRALLAPYFTEPVYDGHREALLDALCGPNPMYAFEAREGSDGVSEADVGRYLIFWWTRRGPPVVLQIRRKVAGE